MHTRNQFPEGNPEDDRLPCAELRVRHVHAGIAGGTNKVLGIRPAVG